MFVIAWYDKLGYPSLFWVLGDFHIAAFAVDICFWVFSIFGTVAAIEVWCRTHGPPKVSLLSVFGATAGIGFWCYHSTRTLAVDTYDGFIFWFWFYSQMTGGYLISFVFGVAVVGWVKLIGIAIERRNTSRH